MLRLTGGEFRGRFIETPRDLKTRPTQARLRQALFNSIQTAVGDARVLDLFAGSGALGFEALSRGAAQVTFVEMARTAAKLIEKNARELKVEDRISLLTKSVEETYSGGLGPFEVILADPPYADGWEQKLLEKAPWARWLAEDGLFLIEWGIQKSQIEELPERVELVDGAGVLVKVREKNYGDSMLTTYQRQASEGQLA